MTTKKRDRKEPKPRKLGRYESILITATQDYAHQATAVINSKQRVLQCEADEIERGLFNLEAAMKRLKERRKQVEAIQKGLIAVVAKR